MPKVIITDLDRTFFNGESQTTDQNALDFKNKLQDDDWIFIPCSDTSQKRVGAVKDRYNFNGPIACERGNALYKGRDGLPIWENPIDRHTIKQLEIQIPFVLKRKFSNLELTITHDAEEYQTFEKLRKVGPQLICYYARWYSLAFSFVNEQFEGDSYNDPYFRNIVKGLQEFIDNEHPNSGLFAETFVGANFIQVFNRKASKGQVVDSILKHFKVDQVFMIGDLNYDDLRHPQVIQCAVGNALAEYKDVCQFVAEKEFTSGFGECLEWITKQ